ncbi:uncharacterized protein F4822DRAFT_442108 [Hypoxylon trugodes]|uniref:uncharacterized protein n=1 Tax=Hypoxylon trugodes TaxID=326681 RepID=UPI002196A118|nr:uncharacterized protein F4822DRAFT_442108 [Hypoxylon trugodes]KAI1390871.1 hypothetical protein F4822DRAFT_442108 [Hypoxylon trugodes]
MASIDQKSTTVTSRATVAQNAVAALYPTQVIDHPSTLFSETKNSFWNTLQGEKVPACFFQPTAAEQVKNALVEVVRAKSPFAIKGGGHSSNLKGSSIQDGFQFDLVNLNHIEIADDKRSVKLGPGLRWGTVFKELERNRVITPGGRDASVGVPGFIFGVSADIVLANGELVTVDNDTHPKLNKALHGGGAHNFGIVTSLTLKLYPYDGMWGGMNLVAEEYFDDVFAAYDIYTQKLLDDKKAHMIMDFVRRDGEMFVAQFIGYTEPRKDPPTYDAILRIPTVANTLRLADYSALAEEMTEVTDSRGKRNAYWTLAMEYDINLLKSACALWAKMTEPHANHFRFAFDVNHITATMRNKAAREGVGNIYGLEGPDKPLTNILLTAVWEDGSDDETAMAILRSLGTAIEALAQQDGKECLFKYMNYAHQDQDVVAGFGEKNKAFLLDVAAKYDPEGIFQNLQLGGFKLEQRSLRK